MSQGFEGRLAAGFCAFPKIGPESGPIAQVFRIVRAKNSGRVDLVPLKNWCNEDVPVT
jgi:hypothetical protein